MALSPRIPHLRRIPFMAARARAHIPAPVIATEAVASAGEPGREMANAPVTWYLPPAVPSHGSVVGRDGMWTERKTWTKSVET